MQLDNKKQKDEVVNEKCRGEKNVGASSIWEGDVEYTTITP